MNFFDLGHIFEKFRISSSFLKNYAFRLIFEKISILVKIFENFEK